MSEIPDRVVHKAATAMLQAHVGSQPYTGFMELARAALESAAPLLAAQVRRETAEQIAAEIERATPFHWTRTQARSWAARLARKIGEARDS